MVNVVFRKYDGRPHRNYLASLLGEDEHGIWLGVAGRHRLRRGEARADCRGAARAARSARRLVDGDVQRRRRERTEIYCDITTPCRLDERRRGHHDRPGSGRAAAPHGRVELLDEDEFAEHQVRFGYPPDVIAEASAAADWLVDRRRATRTEPFGSRTGVAGPGRPSRSIRVSFSGLTWL